MGAALHMRDDLSATALRALARRERDGRAAARIYALAHALDGISRTEAARLAGMDHQVLRDAVVRYNAEGVAGLHNRPKGRPPPRLSEGEEATLAAVILRGPDPERDGVCAWTRAAPVDGRPFWQELSFRQPEPGVAPPGLLLPEGPAGPSPARREVAKPLQKRASAKP